MNRLNNSVARDMVRDGVIQAGSRANTEKKGRVFNIQHFSLHDGPGIRTLVFLKGCPLKCSWCSNPESQSAGPELMFKTDRCIGGNTCWLCMPACPVKAIDQAQNGGEMVIDRERCDHCGNCVPVCPAGALEIAGREMTVSQVIAEAEKEGGFHFRSGGGITVSGGEPILQSGFVHDLLENCKARLMDTALETCGYGRWEDLAAAVTHADLIHYDIKCLDDGVHQSVTGRSNKRILENLKQLSVRFPDKPIIVRTPVIPGGNDTEEAISAIRDFITPLNTVIDYQLMPYHRFGQSKYGNLGKTSPMGEVDSPSDSKMSRLNKLAELKR
ncbi:MAG: glycyl-radical enzyme activating protein [Desulfobacterales bacterium]|nr:glycyl-radical enzyme activating protein [Desulfobacterales bacterium]